MEMKSRFVGVVTDRIWYADPRKRTQLRFAEKNRMTLMSFDEFCRDPFGSAIPMLDELVYVKHYQNDYRFYQEEVIA